MYRLNQIKLNIGHDEEEFKQKIAKTIRASVDLIDWSTLIILHRSIDARDKNNIVFVYNVAFEMKEEPKIFDKNKVLKYSPISFDYRVLEREIALKERPIVVGFGPAGIFASYVFALNGIRPIVIERGKCLEDRIIDTEKFFKTMELDEESNVCFGEGGAGAFSDGKLNTNNKDKSGVYKFILETFVKFGASDKILYENLPHIGTDKLSEVIKNIRNEIIKLGGEIRYSEKFTYDNYKKYAEGGTAIILAIGNSSRDTFRDLINNGFDIKAKPFAIGYRVAHRQSFINSTQYGSDKKIWDLLGAATYKLTYDVGNGHSVYSFCMCPGGYIINSSNSKNKLSINGMSYNDRGGYFANSAIVETIASDDIIGVKSDLNDIEKAIKMIEFQEEVEDRAFKLKNGCIPYISSNGKEVPTESVFKGKAEFCDKLKSVYENIGLKFDINKDIENALNYFNKKMPGFYDDGVKDIVENSDPLYIIAGVETRTSSPVKLDRDENYMCNVKNFYPCGEGLGHGGGIMSCAADGVNTALKILRNNHYI